MKALSLDRVEKHSGNMRNGLVLAVSPFATLFPQ